MENKNVQLPEKIEAVKYKTEICIDFVHFHYEHIDEIFVPQYGIVINYYNQQLNAFKCEQPRYLEKQGHTIKPEALTELKASKDKYSIHLLKDIERKQREYDLRFQKNQAIANPTSVWLEKQFVEQVLVQIETKDKMNAVAKDLFS